MKKINCTAFKMAFYVPESEGNMTYALSLRYITNGDMKVIREGDTIYEEENALPEIIETLVKYASCEEGNYRRYLLEKIYKSEWRCVISDPFAIP